MARLFVEGQGMHRQERSCSPIVGSRYVVSEVVVLHSSIPAKPSLSNDSLAWELRPRKNTYKRSIYTDSPDSQGGQSKEQEEEGSKSQAQGGGSAAPIKCCMDDNQKKPQSGISQGRLE